jgi:inner membrane protein
MKAPAHIAAGITFTGILCSIYDVNIFQSWKTISLCTFAALIPDVDTTNSLIGKSLYPIAKLINRKFGHRTITHSGLFILFIYLTCKCLLYFDLIHNPHYTMIASFAVLSHIILDMFTLAGVPFLYPFVRNACVIPGNPNYRFTVGDWKAELLVTGVCGILSFSMQPLFHNGFWTQYNRAFGTIKHVHRENNNTDLYTLCDYDYIDNNITYNGVAIVIESKENEITLFDKQNVFTLNADDHNIKINHTKPRPSAIPKAYTKIQFYGITLDSLQRMIANRLITGLIQSNVNVRYTEKAIQYNTNFINLKNKYNFRIDAVTDTTATTKNELAELQAVQRDEQRKYAIELKQYNQHFAKIEKLETQLESSMTDYRRNKLQQELITLKQKKIDKPIFTPSSRTQVRINELQKKLDKRSVQFSGHLTIYNIPDPSLPETRQQYREIEENYFAGLEQNNSVYNNKNKTK